MEVKLKKVITDFIVPMRDKPKVFNGNIPWCRIEDIEGKYLRKSLSNQNVSQKTIDDMNLRVYPVNTLLFTCSASIGITAITKELLCTNQTFIGLVASDRVDIEYLYYYLSKIGYSLKNSASITTIPYLPRRFFEELIIDIPEIEIQQKIASVLSSLDTKIELNNRINAELEAMAKTLYDYWFVQFDFPDKNDKPYKTSGGKMVWNKQLKREIPEGWENGTLGDIANITMGQSPPGESYNDEGKGKIFFQGCTDFGNRFPSVRQFTTSPTRFAREGDILLSVRAPVGTLNIAKEDCCIGRGLAALNSKDNCISYLFGVMINLKQIFDRRNVDGTTFGSITKDDLFSLNIVRPNKGILHKYNEIINPVFQKQNKIELENQKLAELRDWLLPMLMNGQVKVG